ncbi:MAG TPA: prolyl oligopeptidase family serine peptidase [Gemmataceae bacterium]|nr:prolyl oligopeptidase family serine peptidase [Gemmataceae bacterium]
MKSALAAFVFTALIAGVTFADEPIHYPQTRRINHVDTYHGTKVADPYRWLEEDVRKDDDVRKWVEAENKVTFAYLEQIPEREAIKKRLTELWNYERYSTPSKAAGRYFYSKNDGLQNQSVVYVREGLNGKPRVLLDPNRMSKDGTVALSGMNESDDGRFLAYGVAEAGSDWQTWKILDVASGKPLADEIRWIKYGSGVWSKDGKGIFYVRYPQPRPGEEFQNLTFNMMVYYHRVGTAQSEDVLVYKRPDQPEWGFSPGMTDDGRYLIITVHKGTDARYRILYKDLSEPFGTFIDLVDDFDNEYSFIDNDGPIFWFKTDFKAPRGRVIAIDIRRPERSNWKEIVPEAKDNLQHVSLVGNQFIAHYLKDAHSQVKFFAPDGTFLRELHTPGLGSVSGFGGKRTDTETFFTFSSFAAPPQVHRYDLLTGKMTSVFGAPKVKFNPDDYEVHQEFYPSRDGTKIPLFITAKRGLKLDGSNPLLLYGYGGFDIPIVPDFRPERIAWLEMGGVYAQANLRGGGEYGQEWHKAGTKHQKQNVFDDFIAAAEYLIKERYTSKEKLAIQGRSNGGLLVGACMTQRPDLYGACLPGVGVMDMLRFHKFTAGRFWTDDYGSSDDPQGFLSLYTYSPYHALLRHGPQKYPATLVTTADTDDRVVPGHSFKFAAALQANQAGSAPVLIRIETRAGHGAGKPTGKRIEEVSDEWAFLVKNLKMNVSAQ